jgi:hypothetical protein
MLISHGLVQNLDVSLAEVARAMPRDKIRERPGMVSGHCVRAMKMLEVLNHLAHRTELRIQIHAPNIGSVRPNG